MTILLKVHNFVHKTFIATCQYIQTAITNFPAILAGETNAVTSIVMHWIERKQSVSYWPLVLIASAYFATDFSHAPWMNLHTKGKTGAYTNDLPMFWVPGHAAHIHIFEYEALAVGLNERIACWCYVVQPFFTTQVTWIANTIPSVLYTQNRIDLGCIYDCCLILFSQFTIISD